MKVQTQNSKFVDFSKSLFSSSLVVAFTISLTHCASTTDTPTEESAVLDSTSEAAAVDPGLSGDLNEITGQESNNFDFTGDSSSNSSTGESLDSDSGDPLFGKRRAPKIASKPFEKEGRLMNAFYLVRGSEENWQSLSKLIYGRSDRGDFLKLWNSNIVVRPGALIYYNSALRPDDSEQVKIFAEDFGLEMQKYEIKKGDSLSAIGLEKFGNLQTWKELAVLNPQLRSPDQIEVGQVLTLQPTVLDTQAILERVMAEAKSAPEQDKTPPEAPPASGDSTSSVENSSIPPDNAVASTLTEKLPVAESNTTEAKLNKGSESGGMINSDNLIILAIVLIVGGLAAMAIRRRQLARKIQEAAWNAGQGTVTKMNNQG
jgi:hypothetical protein